MFACVNFTQSIEAMGTNYGVTTISETIRQRHYDPLAVAETIRQLYYVDDEDSKRKRCMNKIENVYNNRYLAEDLAEDLYGYKYPVKTPNTLLYITIKKEDDLSQKILNEKSLFRSPSSSQIVERSSTCNCFGWLLAPFKLIFALCKCTLRSCASSNLYSNDELDNFLQMLGIGLLKHDDGTFEVTGKGMIETIQQHEPDFAAVLQNRITKLVEKCNSSVS
jgi:hypothetical protein